MSSKIAKPAVLMVAWYLSQIAPQAQTLFGKLLDYGATFALLGLIAFIFYREWKSSEGYNKERDSRLEELIKNNTKAMDRTSDAINDMREEQACFRNELKDHHRRIEKNRNDINNWRNA